MQILRIRNSIVSIYLSAYDESCRNYIKALPNHMRKWNYAITAWEISVATYRDYIKDKFEEIFSMTQKECNEIDNEFLSQFEDIYEV